MVKGYQLPGMGGGEGGRGEGGGGERHVPWKFFEINMH